MSHRFTKVFSFVGGFLSVSSAATDSPDLVWHSLLLLARGAFLDQDLSVRALIQASVGRYVTWCCLTNVRISLVMGHEFYCRSYVACAGSQPSIFCWVA